MTINLLMFACVLCLVGCENPSGQWQALKDVAVVGSAEDLEEPIYIVKKGELCALGREQVAKIYMYRQVECIQGKGWVMYEGDYPFHKIE